MRVPSKRHPSIHTLNPLLPRLLKGHVTYPKSTRKEEETPKSSGRVCEKQLRAAGPRQRIPQKITQINHGADIWIDFVGCCIFLFMFIFILQVITACSCPLTIIIICIELIGGEDPLPLVGPSVASACQASRLPCVPCCPRSVPSRSPRPPSQAWTPRSLVCRPPAPPQLALLRLRLPGRSSRAAASIGPRDRLPYANRAFSTRDLSRLLMNSLLQPDWSRLLSHRVTGRALVGCGGDKRLPLGSHRARHGWRQAALLHGPQCRQRWVSSKTPFHSKAGSPTTVPLCTQTPHSPP